MPSMTAALTALALFIGGLWLVYFLIERNAEDATERFSEALFSRVVGAVGALAVLMGELANAAGEVAAIIMSIPSLLIAALGFGALSGSADMSPGMFLVIALFVFLAARALSSSRAG